MARAMSGWWPWNPNAMRVRSRILVLVDSTRPWRGRCRGRRRSRARWAAMRRWSCTNAGMPGAARPADPSVERLFAFFAFDREHVAQSFFEEVGAPQPRVGLGDPVELVALAAGEVAGVLPERVAGRWSVLGVAGGAALRRPETAVGARPLASFQARRRSMSSASIAHATTWNGSALRIAFGARVGDDAGDPVRHVGRNVGQRRGAFGAELVEEHVAGRRRCGRVRPTPAGRCRGRRRRSGSGARACRRSRRSRSDAARRAGRPSRRCRR